ncbi:MAG TPA: TraB/GumN family protein [Hyphomonadaceae bacterium]|nr:TraB/GumN family protein [Hyphomonadaceae bacterium]
MNVISATCQHPFPDCAKRKSGTHKRDRFVILGPGMNAAHSSGDGWCCGLGRICSRFQRLGLALAISALALTACAPTRAPEFAPALFVARDADSTLYLYGTIHLRESGEPWGSPAVEAALAQAEEIWTEVENSPANDERARELTLLLGMAPPGRPLSTWLKPEDRERLADAARRLGIEPQALEPMRPWLAGLTLTLAPILRAGYDPGASVDRAIDAYGDAHSKTMRWFETPAQQIGLLAELPDALQRQMLLEAIDEAEAGIESLETLSGAWERGDTQTLERELNESMRDEYPEVYATLLRGRNDAWIAVLMRELEGAGVDFVAVGAAHIVGEDGLVAQLRARGVNVERVGE